MKRHVQRTRKICEISGSQGGESENESLVRYSAVGIYRRFRGTYASIIMITAMMEAVRTSETSVSSDKTTGSYIPEGK
jgi:hypothetical protein